MHILIGLITAIAGLVWALHSLQKSGVDLNAFNPFFWYRRHQWAKKYGENPLYTMDNPMDVAATLILAVAKLEGELSKELKRTILEMYQNNFHLSTQQAQELFSATSYLLNHGENANTGNMTTQVPKIIARTKQQFSQDRAKADSTLTLMTAVAAVDSPISAEQQALIDATAQVFSGKN